MRLRGFLQPTCNFKMEVKINIDTSRLDARLANIKNGLLNMNDPLVKIGDDLEELYGKKNFDSQGVLLGKPWRPLAASTQKARARRSGYSRKAWELSGTGPGMKQRKSSASPWKSWVLTNHRAIISAFARNTGSTRRRNRGTVRSTWIRSRVFRTSGWKGTTDKGGMRR